MTLQRYNYTQYWGMDEAEEGWYLDYDEVEKLFAKLKDALEYASEGDAGVLFWAVKEVLEEFYGKE